MGWNALPGVLLSMGVWYGYFAVAKPLHEYREQKPMWQHHKDGFDRALLRRDWFLKSEAATHYGVADKSAHMKANPARNMITG